MVLFVFAIAQLVGQVLDPSGHVVPRASVVLTDLATNVTVQTLTGPDGLYVFLEPKPGRYSIAVEAAGFQRVVRPEVTLATGEKIRLDFVLTIGAVQESVTITSDAPLLRSESAELGPVIDRRRISELPLNGRSFISLAAPATPSNPGKPLFRRNQFGFVLGGPIKRERTFFFTGYQGSRQAVQRVRTSTVPTSLQRQGFFTEAVGGAVPGISVPRERMDLA